MKLGKLLLVFSTLFVTLSCSSNERVWRYEDAKKEYIDGLTTEEVVELFGAPSGIVDFDDHVSWYYQPTDFFHETLPKSKITSFSIDFKDNLSIDLNPTIITRD